MRGLIVANGNLESPEQLCLAMADCQLWLAVDGGMRHFLASDQRPHRWIGDMDSFENASLEGYGLTVADLDAVQQETFPPEKDMSDTALAIERAIELGVTEFVLMGMLGGRTDHALFNLSLLADLQARGFKAIIAAGEEWLFALGAPGPNRRALTGCIGATLSLYPLTHLEGIDLEGFKYPLDKAKMAMGETLCLSNEVIFSPANIGIEKGRCLVIVTGAKLSLDEFFTIQ